MSPARLPFVPEAVIFDMDGLMLDSERAIIGCLAEAARELGHDMPEVLWLSMVGHSEAVCRHLLDEAIGEAQRERVLQRSHVLYEAVVAAGVPHRPGIIEMLDFLDSRRIPRAVATSARRPLALRKLGAAEILDRALLSAEGKPIGPERWAGAVDSVGGRTLANVLAQTKYRGTVTTCGFVGGVDLPATVLPFILRGVTLAGIDSVNAPQSLRMEAWRRLAENLDLAKLDATITEVGLADVFAVAAEMRQGKVKGRTLVDVNR